MTTRRAATWSSDMANAFTRAGIEFGSVDRPRDGERALGGHVEDFARGARVSVGLDRLAVASLLGVELVTVT